MDTTFDILIHRMARNYLLCLADFPPDLKPEHLPDPAGEQAAIFAGLHSLRAAIQGIYQYFADLPVSAETPGGWAEDEYCWKAIEGPVKLLWALGMVGQLAAGPGGAELRTNKADLDLALKSRGFKAPAPSFAVLEAQGFLIDYRSPNGQKIPDGYKKCSIINFSSPENSASFLRALIVYAACFSAIKNGKPFEIFLRTDFRPLLPGYRVDLPHIRLEKEEIERALDQPTLAMWDEIRQFTARRYPKYRPFYRVPRLRHRGWAIDYSATGKGYGLWSIFGDEQGLRLRMVLRPTAYQYALDHIDDLSPRYQEIFLNRCACTDCIHCGKHRFYQHGDHVHRLCKGPWFYSPCLEQEDLPDIERLIDIHISHLK